MFPLAETLQVVGATGAAAAMLQALLTPKDTRRAVAELQRFFSEYAVWFPRPMAMPEIIVRALPERTRGTHNRRDGRSIIMICPDNIRGGVFEVGQTMIHEMVHYANSLDGGSDCDCNGIHSERFKILAEAVGLKCRFDPDVGWGRTSLTTVSRTRIELIDMDAGAF